MPVSPENIQPHLRKALEIFLKELDSHIYFLQNNLETVAPQLEPSFEHRFHTIRGGAGFLQLHDIQHAAAEGEKMVRDSKLDPDTTEKVRTQLERIVDTLNTQMDDLRSAFGHLL